MSSPTLYRDCLILASATYPSGFSYSLYTLRRAPPEEVSISFLGCLALPYVAVALAVWSVRPELLAFRGAPVPLLVPAALLAAVALALEYGLQAVPWYRAHGRWPRGITLQRFWHRGMSPASHLLLGVVVVGEEVFYRQIWLDSLQGPFGITAPLALAVSSLAYGCNHLAFGAPAVVTKTATGLLYGGLYLLGGRSVWLPIVTHGMQNLLLWTLARDGGG
jgi:membrane protease YdiL (CAAX protease family)